MSDSIANDQQASSPAFYKVTSETKIRDPKRQKRERWKKKPKNRILEHMAQLTEKELKTNLSKIQSIQHLY